MPSSACAVDGAAVDPPPPSAKQFLTSLPRCAYTTALVRDGYSIADWDLHVERLIRSMRALDAALVGVYSSYFRWTKVAAQQEEAAALSRLVLPTVLECLQALEEARFSEERLEQTMLVLALPAADGGSRGNSRAAAPLSVHAFAAAYERPAMEGAHAAVALGMPRSIPEAKDSAWVVDRAPFEQLRPEGAAEVLLCTPDGALLEGLLTNFFVVAEDASGGCKVLTAPTTGIVWGTMRQRVIEACRSMGVAVREEAPSVADRETWREAFLTNSLRVIQPLRRISCGHDSGCAHAGWTRELPMQALSLAERLREHVLQTMQWQAVHSLVQD